MVIYWVEIEQIPGQGAKISQCTNPLQSAETNNNSNNNNNNNK